MQLWSLRPIRVRRHQNQRHVALATGLEQYYLSRLETGAIPRTLQEVSAIAAALDVSESVLTADAIVFHRDGRIEVAGARR